MTWPETSSDARTSAHELLAHGRFRGCVSRAYYGVYGRCTELVIQTGVSMPNGWNNPKHGQWLSNVIVSNIKRGTTAERSHSATLVKLLHDLRTTADYRPHILVDDAEARNMLSLCAQAHALLAKMGV